MKEFGDISRMIVSIATAHNNAWIGFSLLYGAYLFGGVIAGKVVCAISERLATIAAIITVLFIVSLYRDMHSLLLPTATHPYTWAALGVLFVCGNRWYSDNHP
jgi:hypothetical protein